MKKADKEEGGGGRGRCRALSTLNTDTTVHTIYDTALSMRERRSAGRSQPALTASRCHDSSMVDERSRCVRVACMEGGQRAWKRAAAGQSTKG